MPLINLTPPSTSVVVGGLDISELIESISLRQASNNLRSPYVWEGSIGLRLNNSWDGESIDNFINPGRWARGKHAVAISFNGVLFATLRIRAYTYNHQSRTAQMELTQLLKLLDYKTPPEDYRFISNSIYTVTVKSTVEKLLTAAGITNYNLSSIPEDLRFPAPDRTNRSYIELAQEILGERLLWLYHQENETVAVVSYNKNRSKLFERSDKRLIEWNPLSPREDLANVYRVVGGGDRFQSRCELADTLNQVEEIYGDTVSEIGYYYNGTFVPTTITYGRKIVERIETEVTIETESVIQTKKTGYKDIILESVTGAQYEYELRKTYEITDTRYYDYQGRLIKQVQQKDGIAYLQYPDTPYDLYPDALTWIVGLGTTTTEYTADPQDFGLSGNNSRYLFYFDPNVLRAKMETISRKQLYIKTLVLDSISQSDYELREVLTEKTLETWLEKCPDEADTTYIYQRKVFSRDPAYNAPRRSLAFVQTTDLYLISTLSTEEDNVNPPSWEERPPLAPRTKAKLFAEEERSYPGSNDDLIDKREFEYSANSITSNDDAQKLARFFADMEVGRSFGAEVAISLRESSDYIANPTPLSVAWIYDRAMLLDSISLVISNNEGELAWEGITLRRLDPPIDEGTTAEIDISPVRSRFRVPFQGQLLFSSGVFNQSTPPDLDTILVDGSGNVTTDNGFVTASTNQNQFAGILVTQLGSIVVDSNGNVVTTTNNPYGETLWNLIATEGGEVVTEGGFVLTI
jgi:hypothetical protein